MHTRHPGSEKLRQRDLRLEASLGYTGRPWKQKGGREEEEREREKRGQVEREKKRRERRRVRTSRTGSRRKQSEAGSLQMVCYHRGGPRVSERLPCTHPSSGLRLGIVLRFLLSQLLHIRPDSLSFPSKFVLFETAFTSMIYIGAHWPCMQSEAKHLSSIWNMVFKF